MTDFEHQVLRGMLDENDLHEILGAISSISEEQAEENKEDDLTLSETWRKNADRIRALADEIRADRSV